MSRRWLALGCLLAFGAIAQAQTVIPEGPKRIIIALDSSGSVVNKTASLGAARSWIVRQLGDQNNPWSFRPEEDRIGIYHYGVVTTERQAAFRAVHGIDLSQHYVHPRLEGSSVTPQQIRQALVPQVKYRLNVLNWARTAVVSEARVGPETPFQHTYFILVTDLEPNANSFAEEAQLSLRWLNPASQRWITRLKQEVGEQVRFAGLDGGEEPSIQRFGPMYAMVYELIGREDQRLQTLAAQASMLPPDVGWSILGHDVTVRTNLKSPVKASSATVEAWAAGKSAIHTEKGSDAHAKLHFDKPPGGSVEGKVVLTQHLSRQNALLGMRRIDLQYKTDFVVPPSPAVSLRRRLPEILAVSLLALSLAAVAWYLYVRQTARHFAVTTPGHTGSAKLLPISKDPTPLTLRADSHAAKGYVALGLKLPPRWLETIFYRHATVEISGPSSVAWYEGGQKRPLRDLRPNPFALWNGSLDDGAIVDLRIAAGDRSTEIKIHYPRSLSHNPSSPMEETFEYTVSLDLGSESMSAYCKTPSGSDYIDLQDRTFFTLMQPAGPDYLREPGDEGEVKHSKRIRNEVAMRESVKTLGDEHAELPYFRRVDGRWEVDRYRESLFELVKHVTTPIAFDYRIPNPKLLFQYGVEQKLPRIQVGGSIDQKINPQTLICHLTCQVARNLVFESEMLRDAYHDDCLRKQIHLVITVPNVYSPEHVETLRSYVEKVLDVGKVSAMSESDAVAFYIRRKKLDALPRLGVNKQAAPANRSKEFSPRVQFLTIDIGKGTSDLSLLRVGVGPNPRTEEPEEQVHVVSRTGRSSGGSDLTYLVVQYVEKLLGDVYLSARKQASEHASDRVREALEAELKANPSMIPEMVEARQAALTQTAAVPWPEELPVSFLYNKNASLTTGGNEFEKMVEAAVEYAELFKRAYTAQHTIEWDPKAKPDVAVQGLLGGVRWFLRKAVEAQILAGRSGAKADDWERIWAPDIREMTKLWLECLLTPAARLETVKKKFKLFGAPKAEGTPIEQGTTLALSGAFEQLKKAVKQYVDLNTKQLLIELVELAAPVQDRHAISYKSVDEAVRDAVDMVPGIPTHIVIAGQGALFKPLRHQLESILSPLTRNRNASVYLHELEVGEAKDACSWGAMLGAGVPRTVMNGHKIFGTLIIDTETMQGGENDDSDVPVIVDLDTVNEGSPFVTEYEISAMRSLLYCAGVVKENTSRLSILPVAGVIRSFNARTVKLEYKPDCQGIWRLYLNDQTGYLPLRSYADPQGDLAKKLWPAQMPSKKPVPLSEGYRP